MMLLYLAPLLQTYKHSHITELYLVMPDTTFKLVVSKKQKKKPKRK